MIAPRYMTPQEREAYRIGYERGRQEGLRKSLLVITAFATLMSESMVMITTTIWNKLC